MKPGTNRRGAEDAETGREGKQLLFSFSAFSLCSLCLCGSIPSGLSVDVRDEFLDGAAIGGELLGQPRLFFAGFGIEEGEEDKAEERARPIAGQ